MRSKIFFITLAASAALLSVLVAVPKSKTNISILGNNETNRMVNIELRNSTGTLILEKDQINLPFIMEIPANEQVELAIYNQANSPSLNVETELVTLGENKKSQTITLLPVSIYTIYKDKLILNTQHTYEALSRQLRP